MANCHITAWLKDMTYDLLQDMTTALLHAHRCMLKDVPVGTILTNKAMTQKTASHSQITCSSNWKSQVPFKQEIATPGASTFTCKYNPRPDCSKSHHRAEVFRSAEDLFHLLSLAFSFYCLNFFSFFFSPFLSAKLYREGHFHFLSLKKQFPVWHHCSAKDFPPFIIITTPK